MPSSRSNNIYGFHRTSFLFILVDDPPSKSDEDVTVVNNDDDDYKDDETNVFWSFGWDANTGSRIYTQ